MKEHFTTEDKSKQVAMHKNMFDRCKLAIESGFYLEAIFMEYAAIESRLEVLLGVLGAPCNRYLSLEQRSQFHISQRLKCFKRLFVSDAIFSKSKLDGTYFFQLKKWLENRNRFVHGLLKNEVEYEKRIINKAFAEKGLELCRSLYNEVNRIKRLCKSHPELLEGISTCENKGCASFLNR